MSEKIQQRLTQLINQAELILDQGKPNSSGGLYLDQNSLDLYTQWLVSSKSLLRIICANNKVIHYELFCSDEKKSHSYEGTHTILRRLNSVLKATLDDINSGPLITFKSLIQADVFESELEQAQHFLDNGYKIAAAVTAGVVLETAIKELSKNNGISIYLEGSNKPKKLDGLNSELKSAEVYNALRHKQIIELAHIRNKAAHGEVDEFSEKDVQNMIRDIEGFFN